MSRPCIRSDLAGHLHLAEDTDRGDIHCLTPRGQAWSITKPVVTAVAWLQAPQTASMSMADEGGRARSLSLERQHSRFLRGEKYIGFHDEPMHREAGGSLSLEVNSLQRQCFATCNHARQSTRPVCVSDAYLRSEIVHV